jgi:serine/threonine protein kinase
VQSDLFGVGSIIWETLVGERLFDGKTDVEIFKKIRACQIPSIATLRADVPPALVAVLETALAADPANRFGSAEEFAQALSQVMKQAVGAGGQQALGAAVMESKAFMKKDDKPDVVFSAADLSVEPIELTPKRRTDSDSQAMTEPAIKRKPTQLPDDPKKK